MSAGRPGTSGTARQVSLRGGRLLEGRLISRSWNASSSSSGVSLYMLKLGGAHTNLVFDLAVRIRALQCRMHSVLPSEHYRQVH